MVTRLKICLVTPSLKGGGLERVVATLANIGVELYSIWIITLDSTFPFYDLNQNINVIQPPIEITNNSKGKRFFLNGIWLRKTLKNIQPEYVCSFGEKYNPYVLFFLFGLDFKIFVANRASPISSLNGKYSKINPIAYKFADGVILQTHKSLELLFNKYNFKRSLVLGNPIDLVYPVLEREEIILNVGSIGGNKNQDWLIKYYSAIKIKNNNWKLHFIGDGSLRANLEDLVCSLQLKKQIVFHGVVKDIKSFYSVASIFAFTSTSEGFPNALAEAMASGCACIAYDCVAGPSDIIDDGINGFLIPLGNEVEYIRKLKLLMEDNALRIRFGKSAQAKMKEFEAPKMAKRFFDFITT